MSHLAMFLLGPPRIECDGAPVRMDRRKAVALTAYLAMTDRSHPRDGLTTLLWPELDQARGRAALRRTLFALKKAIGEEHLAIEHDSLALRRDDHLWLDVDRFRSLLTACRAHSHPADQGCLACLASLKEAAALYRDDFMAGFTLRDSAAFDDWQSFQSQSLRRELSGALGQLARGHGTQGEPDRAIPYCQRWLAKT